MDGNPKRNQTAKKAVTATQSSSGNEPTPPPEKPAGDARTARVDAPKGSKTSVSSASKTTSASSTKAKPPTESKTSNSSNSAKAMSSQKAQPSNSTGSKTSASGKAKAGTSRDKSPHHGSSQPQASQAQAEPAQARMGERIDKLEYMLEKLLAQQSTSQSPRGNTSHHAHGHDISPERGDDDHYRYQYQHDQHPSELDYTDTSLYEEGDYQDDYEYGSSPMSSSQPQCAQAPTYASHSQLGTAQSSPRSSTTTATASTIKGTPDTEGEALPTVPSIAAKFAIPSGIGKPLDGNLADNIQYLTTHPLDEKNLNDAANKYASPENCPTLDVPRVNSTIWDNLKGHTRTKDLKLQRVQKALSRGLTAFARSVDGHDLSDIQQDTLALLCNAQFELSCLRRECIRPDINPKFSHLCKASNVLTPSKQLFGDDLSKRVKDFQEEHRAAVGVVKGGKTSLYRERRAYRPYPEPSKGRYHEAGWQTRMPQITHRPFLGQGSQRGPTWRKKAPHTQSHPPSSSESKNKGRAPNRN